MMFYSEDPNVFSFFHGYKYPEVGELNMFLIQPFLNHVYQIICTENKVLYDYVLNWITYIFQHPDGKTKTALVFTGLQGTGKNVFTNVLCELLGYYAAPNVDKIEEIVGNYNSVLENKKLIICNEIASVDTNIKLNSEALKTLITEYDYRINEKYKPRRDIQNVANFIFLSNLTAPVKVDPDDRRYIINETSAAKNVIRNISKNLLRYLLHGSIHI